MFRNEVRFLKQKEVQCWLKRWPEYWNKINQISNSGLKCLQIFRLYILTVSRDLRVLILFLHSCTEIINYDYLYKMQIKIPFLVPFLNSSSSKPRETSAFVWFVLEAANIPTGECVTIITTFAIDFHWMTFEVKIHVELAWRQF